MPDPIVLGVLAAAVLFAAAGLLRDRDATWEAIARASPISPFLTAAYLAVLAPVVLLLPLNDPVSAPLAIVFGVALALAAVAAVARNRGLVSPQRAALIIGAAFLVSLATAAVGSPVIRYSLVGITVALIPIAFGALLVVALRRTVRRP